MAASAHNDLRCDEEVGEAPGYWHWHRCSNRAKFRAQATDFGTWFHFCGVHVKHKQRCGWEVQKLSETG